jgi:inosine/xanthosine triphosphate pyrophosphatase family protein
MDPELKNSLSHRGNALRLMRPIIMQKIEEMER